MTFPHPPDVDMMQSVIFVISKSGSHLGLMVFDKSLSEEHPLYMLSIPRSEVKRIVQLLGLEDGSALTFPGTCWADYLAFVESNEVPLGFDEETQE